MNSPELLKLLLTRVPHMNLLLVTGGMMTGIP